MKKILGIIVTFLLVTNAYPLMAASSGNDAPTSGPGYLELKPPFVVNIRDGNKLRFLQAEIQFKLSDMKKSEELLHHESIIRHTMLVLLSEQEANDLYSATGKERLRKNALEELREALKAEIADIPIEDMYFTNFIIQ